METTQFKFEYPVIINAPLREKFKTFYYLDTICKNTFYKQNKNLFRKF